MKKVAVVLILMALGACSDDYKLGPLCAEGAAFECQCDDGRQGLMVCERERLGACQCPSPRVTLPDVGAGPDGADETFELVLTPERMDFGGLEPGQSGVDAVNVTNLGPAPARINFSLEEDDEVREFTWASAEEDHTGVVLEAGDSVEVGVSYTPIDTLPDTGILWVSDHRGGARAVTLTALASVPDIEGPLVLEMGSVPTGSGLRRSIFLRNGGGAPLRIDEMDLEGSGAFSFCVALPSDRENLLCPPDLATPFSLMPNEVMQVYVTYRPLSDGADLTRLVVLSNDPDESRYEVEIGAGGATPCVEVDVEEIDFGDVPRGGGATRQVTLRNCSELRSVTVGSVRALGDVAFSVEGLPAPLPESGLRLEAEAEASFTVRYAPSNVATHQGVVEILSSDPENSPLRIDLSGRGTPVDNCPVAVGGGRLEGSEGGFLTQIGAAPLDTVLFDATGSFDPDDPELPLSAIEWTLTQRPEDSNAALVPEGDPSPSLFLDLAGRYVAELRVFDAGGTQSCEPVRVTILAVSPEDIHVQLVWRTPGDTDPDDREGSDMDLHLLNPNGDWGNNEWDCHWMSVSPNWGGRSRDDDPSLDIDDTDGLGPENINLNNPEPIDYRVGVHYFGANGFGESTATVRIYLGGVLAFEIQDKPMAEGQFWEVAIIRWSEVRVLAVDEVMDQFPGEGFPP